MAEIKITDLSLNGKDLFNDDEDFMDDMDELSEDVFQGVKGGGMYVTAPPVPTPLTPNTPFIL